MAEDIKNLIEKIQQEGVKIAEDKAKEIESRAHKEAERLLQEAKAKAEKLTNDANEQISKMQVKQKTLLAQAGRDLLLVLRKEINASLDKLIGLEVKNTLTPDVLTRIIVELIKSYGGKSEGQIAVSLRKEDLGLLEKGLLHKLQEEVKKGLTLKAEDDIQGGFVISYDNGKSQYDFSDKALAEYIGSYLKPKLAEIFKEAAAK